MASGSNSNQVAGIFTLADPSSLVFLNATSNDVVVYGTRPDLQKVLIGLMNKDSNAMITVTKSNATITKLDVATDLRVLGNTMVSGHITPSSTNVYDLGSSNCRFRDLYLNGKTIYLGDSMISMNDADNVLEMRTKSTGTPVRIMVGETQVGMSSNVVICRVDSNTGRLAFYKDEDGTGDFVRDTPLPGVFADDNLNIGIGTYDPKEKLSVSKGSVSITSVDETGKVVLQALSSSAGGESNLRVSSNLTVDSNISAPNIQATQNFNTSNGFIQFGLMNCLTLQRNDTSGQMVSAWGAGYPSAYYLESQSYGIVKGGYGVNNVVMYTSNAGNIVLSTNGSNASNVVIDAVGNLGVTKLKGGGTQSLVVDNNGNLQTMVSDARLKDNVSSLVGCLSKISQLNPVSFDWHYRDRYGSKKDLGLIAQEVIDVVPEAVGNNTEGYYTLDYIKLVPLLIGAVKDLEGRVIELEGRLKAMG